MDILRIAAQLVRPWAYLRIKARGKHIFDWWLPVGAALLSAVVVGLAGQSVSVFGAEGLVRQITGFVQSLPGFFIAALAAVATFSGDNLDELLPEPTPTLVESRRGRNTDVALTRRRFLCSLFAFLTVQSFALAIVGIFSTSLSPWVMTVVPSVVLSEVRTLGCGVLLFVLWQLLSVTCMGLYYLGYKIHLPS